MLVNPVSRGRSCLLKNNDQAGELAQWVWGFKFESLEPMQSWTQWHTPAILVPTVKWGSETGSAWETCGPDNLAYARAGNKRLCLKQCRRWSPTFEAVLWAPRVCSNTHKHVNTHTHTHAQPVYHTHGDFLYGFVFGSWSNTKFLWQQAVVI